jgi:predicted phosphodiesterase
MVATATVGTGARRRRRRANCDDPAVRTAIVSDLHLGLGSGADLLRRGRFRERLLAAVSGADRLVVLGDILELRDRPLGETLAAAEPVMAALGETFAGREVVLVPGNHDHHLIETWLERRAMATAGPLELEHTGVPEGLAFEALAGQASQAQVRFAYPGLWLRDDVYATHGHYLDRHLTVPTIERLGVAMVERILGVPAAGPDPLEPPDAQPERDIDSYERVQTPVYAFLFGLAQATVGERRGGAAPSARLWKLLGAGETRSARLRSWVLGSVAVPGAVGVANRLGLGPVRPDLSSGAIARAGFEAMSEVVERLAIGAEHVIFGHTHRRGTPASQGQTKLWNTGSWVHSPGLLGRSAGESPYWPGTVCLLDDEGEPQLVHTLDELERDELAA